MSAINHNIIDDETHQQLSSYHRKAIDRKTVIKRYVNQKFYIKGHEDIINDPLRINYCDGRTNILSFPIYNKIIKKATEVLESNGISNYDKSTSLIEFHHRNTIGKDTDDFGWHTDDKFVIGCPVYTIIFYIYKSDTITGGNFKYKINGNEYEHEVKTKDIIIFRGDIEHVPSELSGYGKRDSIVVFIKRT